MWPPFASSFKPLTCCRRPVWNVRLVWLTISVSSALAVSSCRESGPTTVDRSFSLVVTGSVATLTRMPITGATVSVTPVSLSSAFRTPVGGCTGEAGKEVHLLTAADGTFALTLTGDGAPSWLCLSIQVVPPVSTGLHAASATVDSVLLGPQGVGRDTVVVRLTLIQ